MRIFIAIPVTDDIRQQTVQVQRELATTDVSVKWVEPVNLHVTIKFIGEVEEKIVPLVENIMQGVFSKIKPFDIEFGGFGVYPNLQAPRIVWAGITEGAEILNGLAEKFDDTLKLLNVRSEEWQYRGHLTLGRIKEKQRIASLVERLEQLTENRLGRMHVNWVELIESTLTPGGPEYHTIKRLELY